MRLVIEAGDSRVVACESLETMLSPSTGGVALDRVPEVLRAIRVAASALRPATLSPAELDNISAAIFETANHAAALAARAPAGDEDATALMAVLGRLGLLPDQDGRSAPLAD